MLSLEEKRHIKEILSNGLNLNPNINFAYFLNAIDDTNSKSKELESKLQRVEYNQRLINDKLDMILRLLNK